MVDRFVAVILYEDSRATGHAGRSFGPHTLLCQVIADVLGEGLDRVGQRLSAHPKKGFELVLESCGKDFERLRGGADHVVAVVDEDKIRKKLSLEPSADASRVIEVFKKKAAVSAPEFLHVVLLVRNMEALLKAAARALGQFDHPVLAGSKPGPIERDRLCMNAATEPRHVRDAILQEMPSLASLRDLLLRFWPRGKP